MSVSVTTRGNHPSHPTVAMPLPLRPPPLPLWLLTAWPGGAAWCRAALGRGLVVVWLYERPGLAFPYPLRVHPVRCLPAAWLHSSVATSKPLQLYLLRSIIIPTWVSALALARWGRALADPYQFRNAWPRRFERGNIRH